MKRLLLALALIVSLAPFAGASFFAADDAASPVRQWNINDDGSLSPVGEDVTAEQVLSIYLHNEAEIAKIWAENESFTMRDAVLYWQQSHETVDASALECPNALLAGDIPADIRQWFRNPDGSCVQCSIGMCGVDQNVPSAATLLWDTEYGSRERGGSSPSRVASYARIRGIKIYNVTGAATWDWMKWACRNGRPCAIGAGTRHFQTLMGHDPASGHWYVCNNNSPHRIDEYTDKGFRNLHLASGQWCVILDYPAHPARAEMTPWWEEQ